MLVSLVLLVFLVLLVLRVLRVLLVLRVLRVFLVLCVLLVSLSDILKSRVASASKKLSLGFDFLKVRGFWEAWAVFRFFWNWATWSDVLKFGAHSA